jgi:hypothetical protein
MNAVNKSITDFGAEMKLAAKDKPDGSVKDL